MFETLISLFERLIIAHEKLAASQEAILRVGDVPTQAEEKPKTTRAKKEKAPEPVETPKVEEPKPEPAKPKATLADVKAAVKAYAQGREGKSASPKEDARSLMAHHAAGAMKTDDVTEEYFQDVIDACKAGWTPIAAKVEEEL